MKVSFSLLIKIAVSTFILIMLVYYFNITKIRIDLIRWNLWLNLKILFFLFISLYTRSYRWQVLMNFRQQHKITALSSFRFMLIGNALNIIMPAGAGDVAKSYFGFVETGIKERMFSVSLYDKILAIGAISVFAVAAYFENLNFIYLLVAVVSIMPLMLVHMHNSFMVIGIYKNVFTFFGSRVKRINVEQIFNEINFDAYTVVYTFFISVVSWVFTYVLLQYCFELVGFNVTLKETLYASSILTIARLFPFTLNGLGTDEAITIYLFSKTAADHEIVIVGALLYRLILIIVPAVPGIFFILTSKKKK